jgi:hypothetical protein
MGKAGRRTGDFFHWLASGEIVFLRAYAKAKFDNLWPEFLLQLRERFHGKN